MVSSPPSGGGAFPLSRGAERGAWSEPGAEKRGAESIPGLIQRLGFWRRWESSQTVGGRRQASRQELLRLGWGWWPPWGGEAVTVTAAVLVVATWRELWSGRC